jgi:hypothetical protein
MEAMSGMLKETTKRGASTAPVTVNLAFMHEIKEASGELWALLDKLAEFSSHPWLIRDHPNHAVDLLTQLQDQLALYFSLEEHYGYFESPARVAPQFSGRAASLREEHRTIYLDICAIIDRAERLLDRRRLASLTRHIVVRTAAFCAQLKAHEAREQDLLLHAIDGELGGAGD